MNKLFLKTPSKADLKYCQSWMMDPDTMSYNSGYDIDLSGYNKTDGTIKKTNEDMLRWYDSFVNKKDTYYAYIYVEGIDEPVGEIYYYPNNNTYHMGILIQSKYRGKGYAFAALINLEKIAFEDNNIDELHDEIPFNRVNAIKLFKKAGFKQTNKDMMITKEMYFSKKI